MFWKKLLIYSPKSCSPKELIINQEISSGRQTDERVLSADTVHQALACERHFGVSGFLFRTAGVCRGGKEEEALSLGASAKGAQSGVWWTHPGGHSFWFRTAVAQRESLQHRRDPGSSFRFRSVGNQISLFTSAAGGSPRVPWSFSESHSKFRLTGTGQIIDWLSEAQMLQILEFLFDSFGKGRYMSPTFVLERSHLGGRLSVLCPRTRFPSYESGYFPFSEPCWVQLDLTGQIPGMSGQVLPHCNTGIQTSFCPCFCDLTHGFDQINSRTPSRRWRGHLWHLMLTLEQAFLVSSFSLSFFLKIIVSIYLLFSLTQIHVPVFV